ncbi:anthranilate phosphoribosyltransferase [Bacillaceae bacterium Marseille-Q3522]|nr:anthranilate phosphoribosyltransferase [Bacillaceae bacterium Marseille-Q3522]
MKTILQKVTNFEDLTKEDVQIAVMQLFSEEVTDSEIAALLIGLKMKKETVTEIVGVVKGLREKSLPFTKAIPHVFDNCGTGGDGAQSFNISTTAAFVIAGAGIPVAKHGNRSVSSKTGSADLLEQLGIPLDLSPEKSEELLAEAGITFLFAPHVHPRLKRIMKVRRELKIPTIFNLIGPLTNPIELESQVMGIYKREAVGEFAKVLQKLGRKRAVVLNGAGFLDEATLQGENHLAILADGKITEKIVAPEELGLPRYEIEEIRGGDAAENAAIFKKVIQGEKGAYRDTVLFNAGIGIFAGGKADTIEQGVALAVKSIDSGAALTKFETLVQKSKEKKEGSYDHSR